MTEEDIKRFSAVALKYVESVDKGETGTFGTLTNGELFLGMLNLATISMKGWAETGGYAWEEVLSALKHHFGD